MAARDSRNRVIPGLQIRNGRFYAVLWADRGDGKKGARRFPLLDEAGKPIRIVSVARDALDVLKGSRRENDLPAAGRKPQFDVFAAEYLQSAATLRKKPGTLENETQSVARWSAYLGTTRIDRVNTPAIKRFMEMRLAGCELNGRKFSAAAPRTVKLDLVVLRNVLKAATDAGHMGDLPRFPKLAVPPPPRRPLLSPADFERLLAACVAKKKDGSPVTKNGEQLRDFLRLLAFCGAREAEALRIRWAHVDFSGRRIYIGVDDHFTAAAVTLGTGGTSKNRGSRSVDFGPQLETLLREMCDRRAPDSSYLFPSPQRGEKDIPARTLRESLKLARLEAGLPRVGFHDLRHLFCSFAVMAGIDFMTIAGWLGHRDGGILIGKVYGHLLDEHRQSMAARLSIGITPCAGAGK